MRCQEYGVPFGGNPGVLIVYAFALYLLHRAKVGTIII